MIDTKALREKILDLAMRGKLVPQDPNDEPASELLKSIKAEKEELIKQKKIKRDKNETEIFKDSDGSYYEKDKDGNTKPIDVPYDLPEGWVWSRIRNIVNENIGGGTPSKSNSEYWGGEIPWASVKDLNFQHLNKTIDSITTLGLENSSANIIKKNNLIIATRMGVGKIVRTSIDVAINQDLRGLIFLEHTTSEYFRLIYPRLAFETTGTTVKGISLPVFNSIFFAIPPLEEQERIVEKINELFKHVDSIEKEQNALQDLSKQLKQKVLDVAMQGKLVPQDPNDEPASVLLDQIRQEKQKLYEEGKIKKKDLVETEIMTDGKDYYEKDKEGISKPINVPYDLPEGWVWSRISNYLDIVMGTSPKGENILDIEEQGSFEFHQGKTFFGNKYLSHSGKFTKQITKIAEINSIVMSVRAPVGDVNITNRKIVIGRGLAALKVYYGNLEYAYYYLITQKNNLENQASGTTFKSINNDTIKNQLIPIAPISEQERIVEKIYKLFEQIDSIDSKVS